MFYEVVKLENRCISKTMLALNVGLTNQYKDKLSLPCKIVVDVMIDSPSVMIEISWLSDSFAYFEILCNSDFSLSDDSGFTITL